MCRASEFGDPLADLARPVREVLLRAVEVSHRVGDALPRPSERVTGEERHGSPLGDRIRGIEEKRGGELELRRSDVKISHSGIPRHASRAASCASISRMAVAVWVRNSWISVSLAMTLVALAVYSV